MYATLGGNVSLAVGKETGLYEPTFRVGKANNTR